MNGPVTPGVTLCAVTSVAREATVAALRHSIGQIRFEKVLLISDARPEGLAESGIEWRQIAPLGSREEYSRFMLHDLADHIDTGHVLIVQWDGFVRDGRRWQDAFLEYDYIGAVWPQFRDGFAVGNGGFSLRSKRLLEATRTFPIGPQPEDLAICRTHRHVLETLHKMRFAGLDIAREFSYERERSHEHEFGFHGAFNLLKEVPSEMLTRLIGSLEPGVVGPRESVELLYASIARVNFRLARRAMAHATSHPRLIHRLALGLRRSVVAQEQLCGTTPIRGASE